ncbi:mitogen-activated protein kinase kinase kinase anp1 [Phtheirospermum japonicum]|uniref:Mitogen-activated protein kinase kinase kinase anp1 n=1 Tax=Phtheirospermum japonicum TaxID=374723 RepID=A0A830CC23_9LAMI|nr:mitogen-activated protein kinase kinase kinase anp1 [Phtheirospermum japonicum]
MGKGSFGRVYKATLKNPTSKYSCFPSVMAVKSAEVSCSGTIQKEREVMSNLNNTSPYLIKCFGDETTMGENGAMAYNLLLEYGSGGTLADRIEKSGGNGLPELEVRVHTRSVLRGLNHIHGFGYVHCDLKPDNILLLPNGRKVGDFGLAKRQKDSKKRKLEPYWRGTPMYLSPETVIDSAQAAPSDVWAVGCIVLEMLTGKPAWDEKNAEGILAKIGAINELPKIPGELSKDARDFLKRCFVRKSMYRFTCEMLLNHTFVDGLDSDDGATEESEDFEQLSEIESMALVYESGGDDSFQDEWCDASEDDSSSYWCEEKESEVVQGEGVIRAPNRYYHRVC